ncbi:AfsR/SARP family transcriptional regulator [Jiangella mangrovi]|uniref:DNA-binding SARP family transcriptional activator n=1 Tax=Jiangella mangrovi TaxID=1524084 RepID=A0A7W9GPU5_9ACTN|nr:BTAD domain-containing putative transcriptional regulator [Jiangella mangrovi]MBB5787815.1 DNA-binding SARP family transcriptional activator [Jiangella mangrovi]
MGTIRLLGPPVIEHDGGPIRPPRGRKAWALLAYVLLADRPPSRQRLAELFFADAEDPLGALRWTLAELRRTLGRPDVFTGDPVTGGVPGEAIDVRLLTDELADPAPLLEARGELLEGVYLAACPEVESWLAVERHRVSARLETRLRQAAVSLLATGRAADAVPYAARVVAVNPLEEGNHELLVRSLAMAGDRTAAMRQVAAGKDVLMRELGVEASAALTEAASVATDSAKTPPLSGRAAALSQLDAGRAAIVAGAVDPGIQCLRRAVAEAARCRDQQLQARTLTALGAALVHAVRGRDEEGALVLQEALRFATAAGDRATLVTCHRELGFVEVQAGRRAAARTWLSRAQELAETDAELAGILGVRGQNASDEADYIAALVFLGESIDRARSSGDDRQEAWSQSILARAHLLRDERHQATMAADRSLQLAHEQRWMAFLPWPQALRGEVDLRNGDLGAAADAFEQSWVLGCQVGDPCWEGFAARGLGLLNAGRGDQHAATEWLTEATVRCNRVTDRYHWMQGHVLDTAIGTALDRGDEESARPLVATLGALAARGEMRELVVRSQLHRHRLGDGGALGTARVLAADIDNPVLTALLDEPDRPKVAR